ncbi:class I SAM-dependent methyltransferase [Rhodoplanes sp. TEM]|uniref:Class I SAM-dependent methyltransferase n=1 Tax=Rhodoplanes tepidamans TaxID=200616 RepID=A0ABT5J9G8_RHOTP|nr:MULTISPECIES: class I SAM-dependent methyltransferase [Rhodoplanes]MDC7785705.1 class I SAM-dependent methyltransferase [Rhodoplanes tepidamans]MDC7983346.1 class I SAM-dependent methyltransferase [Rhodoplanes sp. TEM]MDQ0354726.1 putative O-methyltransferase YrrM [Rhodoplanes tepidamans]
MLHHLMPSAPTVWFVRPVNEDRMLQPDFAELAWLFTSSNRNRGILRQNFDEAALLWRAVRRSAGPILEIGRRHGGSTALLLTAGAGRPVTSIDIEPAHHEVCQRLFDQTLLATPERLHLIVGDSRVPLPGASFGFAFIDGDHSYEGVKADTAAHWAALEPYGDSPPTVVYHDAVPNDGLADVGQPNHCDGVLLLCRQLMDAGIARPVATAGSSLWLEKMTELPSDF